ncbi:hypothetical protein A3A09_01745 [Candidatus Nomurabacteria bacterium RIFCSPLOWO2_01_FULL_42_20]|uniref:Phosphoribosylformylglycinamidine cyclo-ligase n=1 Tax=Candidatus Nomurabacteria bacterium RIFCSPHIGHO2_01_FULL_42_16 TaxID=1801743 RepID=A0A1F6VMI0_9BACT|nr:MAG: hypothetical protein A2824_01080 [Candidatus Nomurabacteria bacterium RIFCSPHIGHO2_01_FULL_42_16]OGI91344.1 MAG: hypothetical protein A3A09_01745 [Candidatus Nomurabacteria bacterium RIFCSPLOWO2_01_FULL_42_20]
MTKKMTYAGVGVNYDAMDPFKRDAQAVAATTDHFVERFGFKVVPWSRGESVFLIETPWGYLGFVVEGLGTKNMVADDLYRLGKQVESLFGKSFYDQVAQCNVAMVVNDTITLGTLPVSLGQYLAVGDSGWFSDERRRADLIEGTRKACVLARCVWGGGETPTLKGIIMPGTSDLSGAAMGWLAKKDRVLGPHKIQHDDAIILIESSGIHANGLTMARKIADKLPDGYLTRLDDGRTYGETLLDPTHIYVALVEDCLNRGVSIHYAVNITGHGWRKLMRATQSFAYIIEYLPKQLPIFDFLQKHGPVDDKEAYGNFNMGAGFALYVSEADVATVLEVAASHKLGALRAGYIEQSNEKKVVIRPKGLEYSGSTLRLR